MIWESTDLHVISMLINRSHLPSAQRTQPINSLTYYVIIGSLYFNHFTFALILLIQSCHNKTTKSHDEPIVVIVIAVLNKGG